MCSVIPFNKNVSLPYADEINCFIKEIREKLENNLISIYLAGSYARGEATPKSDIDIWCFLNEADTVSLKKVANIIQALPINYKDLELNVQCLTVTELYNKDYYNSFSLLHSYFEGVLLFGKEIIKKPTVEQCVVSFQNLITQVIMSIRHYITVSEPQEKLANGKLHNWVLKPLSFEMRIERYISTELYPVTRQDLINSYKNSEYSKIVDWMFDAELLKEELNKNKDYVIDFLHSKTVKLQNEINDKKEGNIWLMMHLI